MYKSNEEFAKAMSELLFSMRIEETIPYGNDCEYVPMEFAHKIVDDPAHIVRIKQRLYDNILSEVNQFPKKYLNEYGVLGYTTDMYDHAFSVDAYVDEVHTDMVEALEKLEEDQRQARLVVTYAIRTEIVRIESDPESGEQEELETDGIARSREFIDYKTAEFLQDKIMEHLKAQ